MVQARWLRSLIKQSFSRHKLVKFSPVSCTCSVYNLEFVPAQEASPIDLGYQGWLPMTDPVHGRLACTKGLWGVDIVERCTSLGVEDCGIYWVAGECI